MEQKDFNETFRKRTKKLALAILKFYSELQKNDEVRIIGKQLIRSVTSVGANYRATCVARSKRERFSKFCIVVEEADETIYWLEIFNECHLNINVPDEIIKEAIEIVKVMTACKTNIARQLAR